MPSEEPPDIGVPEILGNRDWSIVVDASEAFLRKRLFSDAIRSIHEYTPPTTIATKEALRTFLTHAMVECMQKRVYPLDYDSIRAIEHLSMRVCAYMIQTSEPRLLQPWGIDFSRERISIGDQNMLHYIYGEHPKEADVYYILRSRIIEDYTLSALKYQSQRDSIERQTFGLFRQLERIAPQVLDTLVECLAPYKLKQKWKWELTAVPPLAYITLVGKKED